MRLYQDAVRVEYRQGTYFIQRGKKKSLGILTSSVLVIIQKQSLKLTNDDMHVRSFSAYDLYWQ